MAFKYLKSKDRVLESWFNPVLTGATNQGSNVLPPGSFNHGTAFSQAPDVSTGLQQQPCSDMIDKPAWLDNGDESTMRNGDTLSIGSFFLNGVPLSSWSANFGGQGSLTQKNVMMNWHYTDELTKRLFPDGVRAFINRNETTEHAISQLAILRLVPHSNAIGLNAYIRFNLDDTEIWAKFENVGIDAKPRFVCGDLNFEQMSTEHKIKITGRLWNNISDWFKAKTGIYKCLAKEVLIYSELGQLKKISEGNVIEVLHADENRIKIKYDDTNYFIKRPTYYWFNWYFEKH